MHQWTDSNFRWKFDTEHYGSVQLHDDFLNLVSTADLSGMCYNMAAAGQSKMQDLIAAVNLFFQNSKQ